MTNQLWNSSSSSTIIFFFFFLPKRTKILWMMIFSFPTKGWSVFLPNGCFPLYFFFLIILANLFPSIICIWSCHPFLFFFVNFSTSFTWHFLLVFIFLYLFIVLFPSLITISWFNFLFSYFSARFIICPILVVPSYYTFSYYSWYSTYSSHCSCYLCYLYRIVVLLSLTHLDMSTPK